MLTILTDPAGITGRATHPWDYSISLQANIARHLAGGADCELSINGVRVDPLTDPRMDKPPCAFDAVTVARRPEGFDPLTWVVIAVVASLAVTYALMPKIPGMDGATGKDSPNNRLTAQANTARAYQAIPDVYGLRRVWPDMIQPSVVEYIDNVKYVTEWLCISRGAGTIGDVQYADTPIADIDGASFEVFEPDAGTGYPEHRDTRLLDVLETFASDETNGQELAPPVPFPKRTRAGTFTAVATETEFSVTIPDGSSLDQLKGVSPSGTALVAFSYTDAVTLEGAAFSQACTVLSWSVSGGDATFIFSSPAWTDDYTDEAATFQITPNGSTPQTIGPYTLPVECERFRWNVNFLRGLKGSAIIRAEWWKVDVDGVEISGTRETQDDAYSADTYDQQFRTSEAVAASGTGRYRMQFTRLNAGSGSGDDVAKLEEVFAARLYPEKIVKGVTVIKVTTKATAAATGFSERKFNLRFARHIRTLSGDTLSASRNFGRIMAHIWTLAGGDIAELDTGALAEINTEFGETSELLRFDASLDDADTSLGERLQLVANHARCIVWRDGQKWTVTRDQAHQYPEMQLDYRNLASDGDSAISYAAHLPASSDGVEIEYVDPVSQSKKVYVRLAIASGAPVPGESVNPKKIKLMGCTSAAQAMNRAQLEARRLLYQRVSVSDKALCDAKSLGLGALVRWIDPNDFYGDDGLQAGEVLAITGATIKTSEPLHWGGATEGRISFTGAAGQRLGAPIICTPSPGGATLASVPAGLFVADGITRQCGSRYAFAVGLTEAELESAGLYTVTEIKPAGDGVSVSLAQYDSRIYGYD